jgi:predicted RNase H-related nuclease YkuK (DUF458 family)
VDLAAFYFLFDKEGDIMRFFNSIQLNMSFADVLASIRYFIMINPDCRFIITVGTDSQESGKNTCFATGIHIHRVGQGAWCCVTKRLLNGRYPDPEDRMAREAALTRELADMLGEQLADILHGFAVKYRNFDCRLEADTDAGIRGEVRKMIREMTGYFEGGSFDTRISPEAYAACTCTCTDRYNGNAC